MIEVADRLNDVKEYYFSIKLKEVARLKAEGNPIINLGIGSPDLNPPQNAIIALKESLTVTGAHKYQNYQGIPDLRGAIADFYKMKYNVTIDTTSEILPLMGSKEGIMHISMAFLNKGDAVLIPNPGYPTYSSVTKLVEAESMLYDLDETNNWLPNLTKLEQLDLSRVKLMWINYPHMPTGTNASDAFFEEVIAFGKRHNILIINDNPYSFILNNTPKSIMQHKDAKDVCLELNSISKTFNMAGWRTGMVIGNARYINAVLKVKSNMDSGMFYGIQKGAIEALKSSVDWYENLNTIYKKRRDLVWQLAESLGCTFSKTASGLFVWAKILDGKKSEEFTDTILKKYNIFIAPGTVFGSNGEGYIRFSICANETVLKEAINRVKKL